MTDLFGSFVFDQTEPLMADRITVPVIALGGEKGLGARSAKWSR